jgi:hypothetical protein
VEHRATRGLPQKIQDIMVGCLLGDLPPEGGGIPGGAGDLPPFAPLFTTQRVIIPVNGAINYDFSRRVSNQYFFIECHKH